MVVQDVYAYTVPTWIPVPGAPPVWMLLFWGLILRFVASLAAWPGLGPSDHRRSGVGLPGHRLDSAATRLALMGALVLATRQACFRWFDDPLGSWLPFALAAALWVALIGLDAHDRRLAGLALTLGTLTEVAYIQLGGLHRYEIGVVGGVPLWIVLWWPIAVLVWKEIGGVIHDTIRAQPLLQQRLQPRQ